MKTGKITSRDGQPWSASDDLLVMILPRHEKMGAVAHRIGRALPATYSRRNRLKELLAEAQGSREYRNLPQIVKHMIWEYRIRSIEPQVISQFLQLTTTTIYGVIAEPIEWDD